MLEDPTVLLIGKVSHEFYDRAHLLAGIEQDTPLFVNGKEYRMRGLFRALVCKIAKNPGVYPVAEKQFAMRLQLVESDLTSRAALEQYRGAVATKEASDQAWKAEVDLVDITVEAAPAEVPMSEEVILNKDAYHSLVKLAIEKYKYDPANLEKGPAQLINSLLSEGESVKQYDFNGHDGYKVTVSHQASTEIVARMAEAKANQVEDVKNFSKEYMKATGAEGVTASIRVRDYKHGEDAHNERQPVEAVMFVFKNDTDRDAFRSRVEAQAKGAVIKEQHSKTLGGEPYVKIRADFLKRANIDALCSAIPKASAETSSASVASSVSSVPSSPEASPKASTVSASGSGASLESSVPSSPAASPAGEISLDDIANNSRGLIHKKGDKYILGGERSRFFHLSSDGHGSKKFELVKAINKYCGDDVISYEKINALQNGFVVNETNLSKDGLARLDRVINLLNGCGHSYRSSAGKDNIIELLTNAGGIEMLENQAKGIEPQDPDDQNYSP